MLTSYSALALFPNIAFASPSLHFGSLPPPENIKRIISAGAPADLLLLAVAPEKLVGFSSFDFSGLGCEWLSESACRLPKQGRLSGRASTLSLEKLMALNPDLIIDCGSADDTWRSQARRTSEQTGIPFVLIEGGLADSARQLREIGGLVGETARAELQARMAERFLVEAEAFSHSSSAKVTFYAARGIDGLETGLRGSLHTEAIEFLGLENVARQEGRTGLTQVSMENLINWQPDVILTQSAEVWKTICHSPLWQGLEAVAKKRVLLFDGLPFGWLDAPPGINRLQGMRRLHAWLDPNVGANFRQDLGRFFELFWHRSLSDERYAKLMGGV